MFFLPSPLELLDISHLHHRGIKVWLKRDDLIHPQVSGNKWRKLKYYLSEDSQTSIVSFGGAYSNHLHALAYACHYFQRKVHAIVRADFIDPANQTLADCIAFGMTVECVDRKTYRKRYEPEYLSWLKSRFPESLIISEGGYGELGFKGVADLINEINLDFSHLVCPVGSGTTLAGIIRQLKPKQIAIGVAALANSGYLVSEIDTILEQSQKIAGIKPYWELWQDNHFGGFGKTSPELLKFIEEFYFRYQIILDPIYTGKMMFALFSAIDEGRMPENSKVIALHTGGLQGWRGFTQRGLLPDNYFLTNLD
ncbi:pyridoxal-phosphate dependent enzyme [Catenovulum sp. 2E275]|uniref:1-aminocyclopropane-1-carboxylate deaminase/D-cysteine desulfhydrase n=1 Tax=Catenovulum sp. 2E275 TaxID=2980497 RepID=UPI0021CEF878|nr:pyridoxal-phosphate dependent enzyme [Catenovulum sp. 2E275]MCU4675052.1 pyridoxal-phosphate dependent enzyme [Catenovulum sp. 2E275]